jgi:uncharacterized membrane protein
MKNIKLLTAVILILAILPLVFTIVFYPMLPELVPMHWNIRGEIDSWSPKFPGAFVCPFIGIAVMVLIYVLPKIDPKKDNYKQFKLQYMYLMLFLELFFAVIQAAVISVSLGNKFFKIDVLIKIMVGVLFIFLGKIMPKIKSNYFVGIRTPWTIASDDVWAKTHIHGGKVWLIAGLFMAVLSLLPGDAISYISFALIMIAAFEPIIYSWVLFEKEKRKNN